MFDFRGPPNEFRGFVHRRLIKAATGFVTGGPTGAVLGFATAKKPRPRKMGGAVRPPVFQQRATNPFSRAIGAKSVAMLKFSPGQHLAHAAHGHHPGSPGHGGMTAAGLAADTRFIAPGDPDRSAAHLFDVSQGRSGILGFKLPCIWPARIDPVSGDCKLFAGEQEGPDLPPGGAPGGTNGGPPTGRPNTVTAPSMIQRAVRRCQAGYVLGRDNLCYWHLPRNSKWRKWRPGRKPLFTGGDLNAIKRAASLGDAAEEIFKTTNPAKKAVARSYRANWRKPLKK